MPIAERDPWRMQYFNAVNCPADVHIPTEDDDAYLRFPRHRWVYNKLTIAESQGLHCAPHGVEPAHYPVFSKPIFNLKGMGAGSCVLNCAADYHRHYAPGHLWMTLLVGEHVSTDLAVVTGTVRWLRHVSGLAAGEGTFDYWTIEASERPQLRHDICAWVQQHLDDYTGMVNVETIDGRIIEVHLRFSDQWPDLYGPGWMDALVDLYAHGRWDYRDDTSRCGYSVALFGPHGPRYRHPSAAAVAALLADTPEITSIQITFHEDWPAAEHAMPPGGFRLAVVNGWDLAAAKHARQLLGQYLFAAIRAGGTP